MNDLTPHAGDDNDPKDWLLGGGVKSSTTSLSPIRVRGTKTQRETWSFHRRNLLPIHRRHCGKRRAHRNRQSS
jgi:hypothetical protein